MPNFPRMLILWYSVPSRAGGAHTLIRRLFCTYPQDKLWLLTSPKQMEMMKNQDPIPARENQIGIPQSILPRLCSSSITHRLNAALDFLMLPILVKQGIRIV